MQAQFTVSSKEIKAAITHMERVGGKFSKTTMLKISVLPETIEISKQGMTRIVKAETDGLADVLVPGVLIKSYLSTTSVAIITFAFTNGTLQCGSSKFSSPGISIETIFNIPENDLPINASRLSVLRFAASKKPEEIERLGLSSLIVAAKRLKTEKLNKAMEILKDYEITFEELSALIDKKILE